ncbi:MAG: hypothetical protein AAB658_19075, partial [Chloroflexota bacterium]
MKKHLKAGMIIYGTLLVVIAVVSGCATPATPTSAPEVAPTTPPTAVPTAVPSTAPPADTPAPELVGDPVRGGLMYDKWWVAAEVDAPTGDHPLWKAQTANTRTGLDTWRCKECHGWDYKGVDGAYGSGSHLTGFPGLLDAATMTTEELTAWLTGKNNPDHDFSAMMNEFEIAALVTFMQKEMVDTAAFINADKTVVGNPARGRVKYENSCAACHGQDGKKLNFGDDAEPEFVGTIAVDNPWEFFHKTAFGHPAAA